MNNNTKTVVSSALEGTKTLENLKQAFTKEAEVFAKGSIYSLLANESGDMSASRAIAEMSDNDRRHAELWLGYLDELGDTLENLSELAALKDLMNGDIYPLMAEIADEEGFDEIAEKMRLVSSVQRTHSDILRDEHDRISSPDTLYSDDPETMWHCSCCGYNTRGNMPPERCPLCSYPTQYFSRD